MKVNIGATGVQGATGPTGLQGIQDATGATPSTTNFVTINTNQTIDGYKKTFYNAILQTIIFPTIISNNIMCNLIIV